WDVQFFGDGLQGSRNDRDLLLTIFTVIASGHQLKVIDHHKIETGFCLLATDLGAHFQGGDAWRIVNVYFAFTQLAGGASQVRPVFSLYLALTDTVNIHSSLEAQQTHAQLLLAHF